MIALPTSVASRFLIRPAAIIGFLMIASSGCATGTADNPFVERSNTDGYLLRVESRYTYEVEIYASVGGQRRLIGTVPGRGLEFFEFRYPSGRALSLELESRLGERHRIQPTPFPGGGRVELIIGSDLRRSGFVRRSPEL